MERTLPQKQTIHDDPLHKILIPILPQLRVLDDPLPIDRTPFDHKLTIELQIQMHLILYLFTLLLRVDSHLVQFLPIFHLEHHHKRVFDDFDGVVVLVELADEDACDALFGCGGGGFL